ncbi:hypothetical protein EGI31_00405 [Lacihabitans soyangensis]|uniref:Uncharacterized protein n=1 Tax=Lacihabitans soyangensis TaxID=869394 RepID=A0AAE3GZS0_9BACT|nr:hypothetical protein [Lacihabitans soyangensis]
MILGEIGQFSDMYLVRLEILSISLRHREDVEELNGAQIYTKNFKTQRETATETHTKQITKIL